MTGRILGVHANAMPAETAAAYPGTDWERLFVSDKGKPLPLSTTAAHLLKMVFSPLLRAYIDSGKGVVLSVKLDMDEVRRGVWDDRLTQLAEDVAGMRIILIISHEQENDTKARVSLEGNDRAYDIIKAAAPDLTYATADLVYAWSLKKAKPDVRVSAADAKLRARRKRDIALADAYFGKTFPMGILPEHDGWVRWYDLMAPDVWGMGEIGWLKGPGRPAAIDRQAEWFATDPVGKTCTLIMVWGTGGTEAEAGWLLDDPESAAAVARMTDRLSVPVGYRASGFDGFYVSERSGCLVAAEFVAAHDAAFSEPQ